MTKDIQLKYIEMLQTLKIIFRTLLALLIVVSCLPICMLIFVHYFIKGYVETQNEINENRSIN